MITLSDTISRPSFATGVAWSAVGVCLTDSVGGVRVVRLTQAEMRVLSLIRQGLSNKEISSALGRAEPTIKHQVSACLKKYGVPSRTRLIAVSS